MLKTLEYQVTTHKSEKVSLNKCIIYTKRGVTEVVLLPNATMHI